MQLGSLVHKKLYSIAEGIEERRGGGEGEGGRGRGKGRRIGKEGKGEGS